MRCSSAAGFASLHSVILKVFEGVGQITGSGLTADEAKAIAERLSSGASKLDVEVDAN